MADELALNSVIARDRRRRLVTAARVATVATVVVGCGYYTGLLDVPRLWAGLGDIADLVAEAMPPDFTHWRDWLVPLWDTLAMSVAGTALAVSLSFPLGLLAARNTTPHPAAYHAARTVLNGLRSVPEVIMGIIFVAAVGFGALPGVLALGLHSVGMIGKLFAEEIEHAADAPVEAARAAGARPLQVVFHGVLPQVFPLMLDSIMYRWEYNFRATTVLGLVGAGGIGFQLLGALRILEYREVSALLLVVLAMVTLIDAASGYLRTRLK